MKLGRGRIGACVVMVSLFAAIIGGWALSTDVTDKTVTTYESVADITGYFESSNLPTSIAYNPGENYTGYYTADSNPYFGGVDFTESKRANNYPIKQPTTAVDSRSGITVTSTGQSWNGGNTYFGANGKLYSGTTTAYNLEDFVTALNLTPGVDRVDIKSIQNYTDLVDSNYIDFNGVVFVCKSWVKFITTPISGDGYGVTWCALGYKIANPTTSYYRMCLSASLDLMNETVSLYFDNACSELCGVYSLDDVMISKNSRTSTTTTEGYWNIGTTVDYASYDVPTPKYMEISRGVYWS